MMMVNAAMETTTISVPSLDRERYALDLANALIPLKGVGQVSIDLAAHTVAIEYDSDFVGVEMLRDTVCHSGYPLGTG